VLAQIERRPEPSARQLLTIGEIGDLLQQLRWKVDVHPIGPSQSPRQSPGSSAACENNAQIVTDKENYFFSADGLLMPARKDQPPPDLRYFKKYDR
jgi:hypothetical protein